VRPNETGSMRIWTVEEVAAALRRQARVLTIAFLALSAGIAVAMITAAPLFEGRMKILVKRDRSDSVITGAPESAVTRIERELSETELLSQVELLRSEEILRQVAAQTGLAGRAQAEHPSYSPAEAEEAATEALRRRLTIAPLKRTWLIDVAYEGHDRRQTRAVLDTLVRLYFEKHLSLQRPAGTYDFFVLQAERARTELDALRTRLVAFSDEHQVVSAALEKQAVLEKLSEFDALRAQSEAQLAETAGRLTVMTSDLATVPERRTSEVRTDSGLLNEARSRIVSLEMQRAQLLQKFTPEYRGVQEIDAQLREARVALDAAERSPVREETVADNPTREWLDTELARRRADQAGLSARLQVLSSAVGSYRERAQTLERRDSEQQDLERELQAARATYLLYVQKREEARISDELDRTRIANVAVAEGPVVTVRPHREPSLAFLPLLLGAALFLSGGLALSVDALAPACRRWRAQAADRTPILGPISPSEESLS
jgi:succinoglycan biosynthesis transport protein ExoP